MLSAGHGKQGDAILTRSKKEQSQSCGLRAEFAALRAGCQPDGFDPYPVYRSLREFAPVWRAPWGDWYVSGFEDASKAATDASLRRSPPRERADGAGGVTGLSGRIAGFFREWLVFCDPPEHALLRREILRLFLARDADALVPEITSIGKTLVAELPADHGDVVAALTYPLPVNVISGIVGIPDADRRKLAGWTHVMRDTLDSGVGENDGRTAAIVEEIQSYYIELVRDRTWLNSPAGIRFAPLLKMFPAETIAANLALLVFTGHDTTVHLIGSMLLHLSLRPDLWRRLLSEPGLVPAVVAETLRYESPIQKLCRWTSSAFELGGEHIPGGAAIVLLFGAANRDPAQFSQPDIFDIDREPRNHLAFGRGAHLCVGRPLAIVEAETMLRILLDCWQEIEVSPAGWHWYNNSSVRGLSRLNLSWRTGG